MRRLQFDHKIGKKNCDIALYISSQSHEACFSSVAQIRFSPLRLDFDVSFPMDALFEKYLFAHGFHVLLIIPHERGQLERGP